MARTADQISQSLKDSVKLSNPNIDLSKGPVFDTLLAPVALELAETESQIEEARRIASFQLASAITEEELNVIGESFGLSDIQGLRSKTVETFWTVTKPTSDLPIERGTIVATTDGVYAFVVTERVVLRAVTASAYLNTNRRRYEIDVPVEAVAAGEAYNLPAFRITRLLTPVAGFDGAENRVESSGGSEKQSFESYLTRVRRKFSGLSPESGGGIISSIFEFEPEVIKDVTPVFPKDRKIFRRNTGRPAIDFYILGETESTATQQYVASSDTLSVILDNQPVNSISSVLVDGEPITSFALQKDTRASVEGSARAQDKLILGTALQSGQVAEISYSYNTTINSVQSQLLDTLESLMETDCLAREFQKVAVAVQIDITVLPSFDPGRVSQDATSLIYQYVEPVIQTDYLSPEEMVQRIRNTVSGVSSVRISRFTSTRYGTLPVETINFEKNQIPVVDTTNLVVSTRQ